MDEKTSFYYMDFGPQLQLREVILGTRNETPVGQVAELIQKNSAPVQVFKVRPGFQKFAMVRKKSAKAINVPVRR